VSPILTRPIREQLEHDRIIRQLQARYKRKHEVAINPGPEQNQSVMVGDLAVYPDLLLYSQERGRRLEGTIEVETAESVNQLEALAEWGVFTKLKAPFYLYVPPQSIDSARRICDEQQFPVAEIWTYHLSLDQVRFTQVYRSPNAPRPAPGGRTSNDKPAPATAKASAARGIKAESAARNGKLVRAGRTAKAAVGARTAKAAKPSRSANPGKSAKSARSARPVKSAKLAAKAAAGKRAVAGKRR
jgi:hypothetical protein